ncbi:MAG: arsenite efflux transporter metallochaperone ArsD [Firmicutes bacterium]|nr:arsenite efflux transporter metallochaperone ArsD [Bacillota bacterium]
MKSVAIYDPAMCCSTGVCGPSPSQELARVATDLQRLIQSKVEVKRYNLSQQPGAFMRQDEVRKLLTEKGPNILPIVVADGKVRVVGRYPTTAEFEAWLVEVERVAHK